MPIQAMTLRAGDKVENIEGRAGLVLAVRRDADCNCVAIAWDNHNVLLYSRYETLDVSLVGRKPEGEAWDGQDFLPSTALNTLYGVVDPSNWFIFALLNWRRHKAQLARISEHGYSSLDDVALARAACAYLLAVIERMRGIVIDFTQN